MRISLRFLYLLPLLAIIVTLEPFTEFIFPSLIKLPNETPAEVEGFTRLLLVCSGLITLLCYRYMAPLMKCWLFMVMIALGLLALESYDGWYSWMIYPHVFAKLLSLLHVFAIYGFYRRFGLPPLGPLMSFLLAGILANLVYCHPTALSMSAFLNNERGVAATAPMLLLLISLYYFNAYLTTGRLLQLGAFLLGVGLIIFLQHRSVWVAMGVALVLNVVLVVLGRVTGARFSSARVLPLVLVPLLVLVSGGLAAVSNPRVLKKLEAGIDDIQHADKQGTGSWRLDQFNAYQPFIDEYPVAGMRLKGFELPVQFYHLADDGGSQVPVWKAMTGHHFHSFYIDRLFYFGISGLILILLVPVSLLVRRVLSPVPMSPAVASCIIFSFSMLVFGFSYDWPLYFFAVLGLSLAAAAAFNQAVLRLPITTELSVIAASPATIRPSSFPHYANAIPATRY